MGRRAAALGWAGRRRPSGLDWAAAPGTGGVSLGRLGGCVLGGLRCAGGILRRMRWRCLLWPSAPSGRRHASGRAAWPVGGTAVERPVPGPGILLGGARRRGERLVRRQVIPELLVAHAAERLRRPQFLIDVGPLAETHPPARPGCPARVGVGLWPRAARRHRRTSRGRPAAAAASGRWPRVAGQAHRGTLRPPERRVGEIQNRIRPGAGFGPVIPGGAWRPGRYSPVRCHSRPGGHCRSGGSGGAAASASRAPIGPGAARSGGPQALATAVA